MPLALIGVASAKPEPRSEAIVLSMRTAPPLPPDRQEPEQKPRKGSVWSPGFWKWNGVEYRWIPGEWIKERSGHQWVPPRWHYDGERWHFSVGHWTRE